MNTILDHPFFEPFSITFLISWLLWFPTVLKPNVIHEQPIYVGLLRMFAPSDPLEGVIF